MHLNMGFHSLVRTGILFERLTTDELYLALLGSTYVLKILKRNHIY